MIAGLVCTKLATAQRETVEAGDAIDVPGRQWFVWHAAGYERLPTGFGDPDANDLDRFTSTASPDESAESRRQTPTPQLKRRLRNSRQMHGG
jgi:hypothetical protein